MNIDTNTTITFIDKAVQKTKANELRWHVLPKLFKLKPLQTGLDTHRDILSGFEILTYYSYYAEYKSGYLLLLVFCDNATITSPPNDCVISLRVQEDASERAIEIGNSQFDPVDSANLIRLYNLLTNGNMESVNLLVEDFLNS